MKTWETQYDPALHRHASGVCLTRLCGWSKQCTYLMMSSYLVHCSCYKDWDAPSNKELPAAAAVVVLGSAGCKATGEVEVLAGWKDGEKGSAPVLGFELEPTDVESQGAVDVGVDGAGVGCGGALQA